MNTIIIRGNLCSDLESRQAGAEHNVVTFGVAVNEGYGEKKRVSFFNIEVWGKQGELCQKYLAKGASVLVKGRMQQDRWEKDGQKRTAWKLVADPFGVEFLTPRSESAGPVDPDSAPTEARFDDSDDIPF